MIDKFPIENVCVVGLGLMGGSLARALRKYSGCRVSGCEIDNASRQAALADGTILEAIENGDFSGFDLVFFALYPRQTVDFILEHLDSFSPGTILVDLCGVKGFLAEKLTDPCRRHGLFYIGGHPMAGKEKWGYGSADAELYQDASMLLTPEADTPEDTLRNLETLLLSVGFSRVVHTTPKAHDEMIAFTSQLAHVASSAYIKSPRSRLHHGFSAGSYKDMTRVARLNPKMWTELFLENSGPLLQELDTLISHLSEYRDAIRRQDAQELFKLLDEGRRIKEELDHESD